LAETLLGIETIMFGRPMGPRRVLRSTLAETLLGIETRCQALPFWVEWVLLWLKPF